MIRHLSQPHGLSHPGQRYMPHVDGLRAVAIIPVILYHLSTKLCPGGFAGVDVFFVISGYLISAGIITDLKAGRYSLTDFYVRRIKRILPAYVVLILFVLAAMPFHFSVNDCRSLATTVLYSLGYSANVYFYHQISYFDLAARQNPLLHLWSLGVEEQFYLVLPLCVLLIWKIRKSWFFINLVLLGFASLVYSCLVIHWGDYQMSFFMLPSRAWELLVGAILSQLPAVQCGSPGRQRWANGLFLAGGFSVLVSYVFVRNGMLFPGTRALPSVLGAACLIRYGEATQWKWLSLRPMIFVGKISYSLYLWHWPLFIFLGSEDSTYGAVTALLATVVAAYLSWRFVETPVRRLPKFRSAEAFGLLGVSCVVLGGACFYVRSLQSKSGDLAAAWQGKPTWVHLENERSPRRSSCRLDELTQHNSNLLIKLGSAAAPAHFALWGDSHALALMPGVDAAAAEHGVAGYFINLKHSFTLNPKIGVYPFHPREDREPVLRWLESRPDIQDVYLVNRWTGHLRGPADLAEVKGICERLNQAGKHVFFFRSVPAATEKSIQLSSWGWQMPRELAVMTAAAYDEMVSNSGEKLLADDLTKCSLATVAPLQEAFWRQGSYATGTPTHSFYSDTSHVNADGALQAVSYVAPFLWPSRGGEVVLRTGD